MQDSGRGVLFKPNERICINQERGALLTQLACLNDEITALDVRTYKVPPQLELKIRFALEKLEETNF
ncbi:MAG: hypothetical protein GZ087_03245 [Flavobacterium sp.]|nr:hypothetical protein [Flavobacterium sp.]